MASIEDALNKGSKRFKPQKYRAWDNDLILQKNISSIEEENIIHEIAPSLIRNWSFHDRPETELGDIDKLSEEFKTIGQQQPCIVRLTNNDEFKYELIVGERRWRAAQKAMVPLKFIIKTIDDHDAAIIQSIENDSRKDLSDYAKGRSFSLLIEQKIIKQKDLIEKLGKSKQYISALLSYNRIPSEVSEAIGDLSKVKYHAAEKICQLSQKGDKYIKALITIAEKIRKNSISAKVIEREVNKLINPTVVSNICSSSDFKTQDGIIAFKLTHKGKNKGMNLEFTQDVVDKLSTPEMNELLIEIIEKIEEKLKKESDKSDS